MASGLSPCPLNDEADEGLGWPEKMHQSTSEVALLLQTERLEVDVEIMQYIRSVSMPPQMDQEVSAEILKKPLVRDRLQKHPQCVKFTFCRSSVGHP